MRWLAGVVLLVGCVRARATVVYPTGIEQTKGGFSGNSIARQAPGAVSVETPPTDTPDESTSHTSLELGALLPLTDAHDTTRVYIAPGVRFFGPQARSILWGVAVGADFIGNGHRPPTSVELSGYAGGGDDKNSIEAALDLFGGITMGSVSVGPSVGLYGLPGGRSSVMLGLGVRLAGH